MTDTTAVETGGISVLEAASRLGVRTPYIYRWVRSGRIGVVIRGERRRNRGMRVDAEDVRKLQAERKQNLRKRLLLIGG